MKELNEYTDEEKIKWFDMMYTDIREQLAYAEEYGYERKDGEYYTWESTMDLLGDDVWERYNAAVDQI